MAATTIRDLGKEMARRDSEQRQAEINASLGAELNPDNRTPFQDQNEFLSNEVKKIGEASAERARLTSERAKEEYDSQVRGNIIKEKELAENQQRQADLTTAQTQTRNFTEAKAIAHQLSAIPRRPGETEHTRPMDELRQESNLLQKLEAIRASDPSITIDVLTQWAQEFAQESNTIAPQHAQPQPPADNGPAYQITKTDNGVEVRFATGEIFKGSADEVLDKIARSKAETRRWADGFRSQLQERQQPDLGQQYSSISDYWTDQQAEQVSNALAKRYGFSNEQEMVQYFKRNEEIGQTIEDQALASDFYRAHPEFPGTDAASDVLTGIIEQNGWQWNINSMEAAHALAVQRGMYQPLSQELIAAANGTAQVQRTRPSPPPMVQHGGNPEIHSQAQDVWTMPLAELRKQAIKAQLEGGQ